MKLANILVLVPLLLWSCATKKAPTTTSGGDLTAPKNTPEWVYAPNEACKDQTQLCASSEGTSIEAADLNAKKSLASIFQTNIKSNFQIHTTAFEHNERSNLTEQVLSEVEENLEMVLRAVEIKERHQQGNSFYSLAVLDKHKAGRTLALEIKSLDDQLHALYGERKKINLNRMLVLFDQRQLLNERYIIVKGKGIPSQYTFSKIMQLKYVDGVEQVQVLFNDAFPQGLRKWFEGLLSDSGFKVVTNGAGYSVLVNFRAKPAYLNVEGFKKFTFEAEALSRDLSLKQMGSFTVSLEGTGRNENDAFLKIKSELQKQIQNSLNKLNLK